MNEYERQLEKARLARRQGIQDPAPYGESSDNRIEELLRSKDSSFAPTTTTLKIEPKPAPQVQARESNPRAIEKKDNYRRLLKRTLYIVAVFIFIPLVAFGGYRVFKNFEAKKDTASSVLESVGKLVSLPEGEEPTVATITDLTPLSGQEFFKDARIGDKVIIYKQAGKAILYRPSQNKIITAAPLTH